MRFFGLEITRTKAAVANGPSSGALLPADNRGGWWGIIRESFGGAWQQNVEIRIDTVLTNSWVFRCISLISSDIAKLCLRLVEEDANGIWAETDSPSFSPVLRKPNGYQNRIQFIAQWLVSKLSYGNAYVLKERDNRGVVVGLYILDPLRVTPLVAPDGSVFYRLMIDWLSGITSSEFAIPAEEIIHDRWNCLFHPLVGLSPIYACGLAAVQGIRIQSNSANFFGNAARPGGVLTAPGAISDETAARLKAAWDAGFTGANAGKVAVLGDGLKFEAMVMSATDAQLIEQLKWSAETICGVFGVPAYKLNVGAAPLNNNVEALEQQYYSQCLQIHIESIELCIDEGLALPDKYGVEFDLDGLLRMDTASMVEAEAKAVGAGIKSPNESRARMNLAPVAGGQTPYLQIQNYSLAALDARDKAGPPVTPGATPAAPPAPQKLLPAPVRELAVVMRGFDMELERDAA